METLARRLQAQGVLDEARAARLEEVETERLVSLHYELRSLLYLGALCVVAGVGATVRKYFHQLGHLTILGALTAASAACLWYCFSRARPFDRGESPAPTAAFDYVLFLACALIGVEFAYLETHFKLLKEYWDFYLLASGAAFTALAYRFDNRLVLAMGILNLGAWLGIRFRHLDLLVFSVRGRAALFGLACVWAGFETERRSFKAHFKDTWLKIGANVFLAAALSGSGSFVSIWPLVLFAGSAAVARYAFQVRQFAYLLIGVAYAYAGVTRLVFEELRPSGELVALYFAVSAVSIVALLFTLRRELEAKE